MTRHGRSYPILSSRQDKVLSSLTLSTFRTERDKLDSPWPAAHARFLVEVDQSARGQAGLPWSLGTRLCHHQAIGASISNEALRDFLFQAARSPLQEEAGWWEDGIAPEAQEVMWVLAATLLDKRKEGSLDSAKYSRTPPLLFKDVMRRSWPGRLRGESADAQRCHMRQLGGCIPMAMNDALRRAGGAWARHERIYRLWAGVVFDVFCHNLLAGDGIFHPFGARVWQGCKEIASMGAGAQLDAITHQEEFIEGMRPAMDMLLATGLTGDDLGVPDEYRWLQNALAGIDGCGNENTVEAWRRHFLRGALQQPFLHGPPITDVRKVALALKLGAASLSAMMRRAEEDGFQDEWFGRLLDKDSERVCWLIKRVAGTFRDAALARCQALMMARNIPMEGPLVRRARM